MGLLSSYKLPHARGQGKENVGTTNMLPGKIAQTKKHTKKTWNYPHTSTSKCFFAYFSFSTAMLPEFTLAEDFNLYKRTDI